MNKELNALTYLDGMASIFLRGFMEQYAEGERTMRGCQAAGMAAVKMFDIDISISYVSTLTRKLQNANVIGKTKKGRSYHLMDGPNIDEFIAYLEEKTDYGTRLSGNLNEDLVRSAAIDHIEEYGALLATAQRRIPKAAYKLLQEKVLKGELDMAFIKPGLPAGVKYNGATQRITVLDD